VEDNPEALLTELCSETVEQADVELWRENARTPEVAEHFVRHRHLGSWVNELHLLKDVLHCPRTPDMLKLVS
jgi:hypothetical protein